VAYAKNGRLQDVKSAAQETAFKGPTQKHQASDARVKKGKPTKKPSQLGGAGEKSYKGM
jgi:hypothetical protein